MGGCEAVGVEGSGSEAVSERGPAEGENCAAIAAGDDNDVEMGSGPAKNGGIDDLTSLRFEKQLRWGKSG
jgi:hypothetical protein